MRCRSCDCELTDFEATRKYNNGNEFLDLCGRCSRFITPSVDLVERFDLFDPDRDTLDYEYDEDSPEIVTNINPDSIGDGEYED